MSVPVHWKEGSWTDIEESKSASKEEANPINIFGMFPTPQARPNAKQGPIIPIDTEELNTLIFFGKTASLES